MNNSVFAARPLTRSWPLLALLLIAVVWLYRSPYNASNLKITPDSVEYALAPLQVIETGRYEIMIEGRGLPPRYPPWFPVLVILPAYVLFGHDPGNAILPITLLAVAGVAFTYAIGKRISSAAGGVLAALMVLFLPSYTLWTVQVMTDVPCTVLMLAACLVYLHLQTKPQLVLTYLGAGVLVAITTLFRPVFAAMLLPFLFMILRQRQNTFFRAVLLLIPMVGAAAATFVYNAATFGSPLRNGYKFWVPAPMDYPAMMFSLSNFPMNLSIIWQTGLPILVLVCVTAVLLAKALKPSAYTASREVFQQALLFFSLTTVPILLFHLFYFYPNDRFYVPLLVGTAVLAGSMFALLIGSGRETVFKVLLPAIFLIAVAVRITVPAPAPLRRLAAEQVRKHTPENAVIISGIDPVYLARLAGYGSARRIVPVSRNVEFAWALLVRQRVDDARLRSLKWPANAQQVLDVLRPHAEQAVRFVASEGMDELASEVARGTPVFFEASFIDTRDAKVADGLKTRFKLVECAPSLYQLQSR